VNDELVYRGKVGTGFDGKEMERITAIISKLGPAAKPISDKIPEEMTTIWVIPDVTCEVVFASLTSNGTYREPVYQFLVEY